MLIAFENQSLNFLDLYCCNFSLPVRTSGCVLLNQKNPALVCDLPFYFMCIDPDLLPASPDSIPLVPLTWLTFHLEPPAVEVNSFLPVTQVF